jgi:CRP-like cAMP-binding protein
MENLRNVMRQMISISDEELDQFESQCFIKKIRKNEFVSEPNIIPSEIFFINKGIIRVLICDFEGNDIILPIFRTTD